MEKSYSQKGVILTVFIEQEITVAELLKKNDLPEKGLIVVINGLIAPSLETIIKPEDKILILPAVAGGILLNH